MTSIQNTVSCDWEEKVYAYATRTLSSSELATVAAHVRACGPCQRELRALRRLVDVFVEHRADLLRPLAPLKARLAERIAADTGREPVLPAGPQWREPSWEEVAPGIECKLLATDPERQRVSMLVRLAPGVEYPPHMHSGREELHLLDGELWIDERKLRPGDYNRAEEGTSDSRVWSETGCTCVLIASTRDLLL